MRSTLSNPIEAGVDSFAKMTGAFDAMELTQQRKTLMAQEEADRKLRNEKESAEFAQEKKQWTEADEQKHGTEHLNHLQSAINRSEEAKAKGEPFDIDKLSTAEEDAIIYGQEHHLGNVNSNDIARLIKFMRRTGPQIKDKKAQLDIDEDTSNTFTRAMQIPEANITTDDYGNKFKNAKITGVAVDGTSPDMPMGLKVTREITPGVYKHIGEKTPTFVAPDSKPQNMVEKGNIDLNARPVVKNQDGSISTVKSLSIEQDGKEVLIPSISPDGKALSTKDAIAEWEKTKTKDKPYGDHLGVFNNVADADAYAQQLHSSSIWKKDMDYYTKPTQEDLLKHGGGGDPNAPYVIHPAEFYHSKLNLQKGLADLADQLEAKLGGEKYRERKAAVLKAREENKAISEAYKTSGGDLSKFMETILDKYPEMPRKDAKEAFDTFLKTKPKLQSKAGKEMSDREELIKAYGEDSPEVKTFDKSTQGKEAGANKTIYGPGGQTKEVFIDKGKDYVPPKGWSLKPPKEIDPTAHQTRIDNEVDKVEKMFVEHYDKDAKTVDDLTLDDNAKKELTEKIKQAEDHVRKGKGSANEAYHKFGAEKVKSAPKPITKKVKEAIAAKFKDMPNGPAKVKKMEEEAKRRGYDPSKTEY